MADELNTPNHRWYEPRNNIKLAANEVSKQFILASGISKIDTFINAQSWGNPVPGLFALAEPGVWYDPSDLTTLFQDSAGTTPVTAAGQTVGLMLDKSQGLVLGSELRGSGAIGLVGTATAATYNTTTGVGTVTRVDASNQSFVQWTGLTTAYSKITVSCTSGVAITVRAGTYTGSGTVVVSGQAITFYSLVSGGTITITSSSATSGFTVTSIKEAFGNHATQATSTQRPTYGINPIVGTRNLLTFTEQFDNAAWTKVNLTASLNSGVAPDGTATADKLLETTATNAYHQTFQLSAGATSVTHSVSVYAKAAERNGVTVLMDTNDGINFAFAQFNLSAGTAGTIQYAGTGYSSGSTSMIAVGNGWYRCTITASRAVAYAARAYVEINDGSTRQYTGNASSGILIWGAQLELGSTATAYQKVVSQYEVTQAGVQSASYLAFDGVDDGMVTNTITPGIDKVQVFAGVRKLSDAAAGIIFETGTTANSFGAFYLANDVTPSANFSYAGRGARTAVAGDNASALVAAPTTAVLAVQHDINAGTPATIRRNGSLSGSSVSTTFGGGNFLAYPLYIGRRGGASLPFNGRIYSLITRFGANLTDGQITSTESWVNAKTGAY